MVKAEVLLSPAYIETDTRLFESLINSCYQVINWKYDKIDKLQHGLVAVLKTKTKSSNLRKN